MSSTSRPWALRTYPLDPPIAEYQLIVDEAGETIHSICLLGQRYDFDPPVPLGQAGLRLEFLPPSFYTETGTYTSTKAER